MIWFFFSTFRFHLQKLGWFVKLLMCIVVNFWICVSVWRNDFNLFLANIWYMLLSTWYQRDICCLICDITPMMFISHKKSFVLWSSLPKLSARCIMGNYAFMQRHWRKKEFRLDYSIMTQLLQAYGPVSLKDRQGRNLKYVF